MSYQTDTIVIHDDHVHVRHDRVIRRGSVTVDGQGLVTIRDWTFGSAIGEVVRDEPDEHVA